MRSTMKQNSCRLRFTDGRIHEAPPGTKLLDLLTGFTPSGPLPVLAARLDHRLVPLDEPVIADAALEWVTYADKDGQGIYQRSASFVLSMAVAELYHNTRLVIGHSIANGLYYNFLTANPVNQELLEEIEVKMREIVRRDDPFRRFTLSCAKAVEYFRSRSMSDTLRLIEYSDHGDVQIYENGRFATFELYPLVPSTGFISHFELKTYGPGLVLLFPDTHTFDVNTQIGKNAKLFDIYRESNRWGRILGVNDAGRLNQIVQRREISELIKVSESLHEKKIARIADHICEQRENIRLVLISGPSASGKTTFSKRLAVHLKVNGIRPKAVSIDNYFVDRDYCPRDEYGEFDFESLETVDLQLFNRHLQELLDGREVLALKFDFEAGQRVETGGRLRLEDDQILIVEGIHGLNGRLTEAISRKHKFLVYISALTQLLIDDHHRISTTDTRMLRRLVRDAQYRGYTAPQTLKRFPSVVRGEQKWVFPFQENADVMFNSALVYELAVLKDYALPLLSAIPPGAETHAEAQRLLTFLRILRSVPADEIPPTSILREFVGGSTFRY